MSCNCWGVRIDQDEVAGEDGEAVGADAGAGDDVPDVALVGVEVELAGGAGDVVEGAAVRGGPAAEEAASAIREAALAARRRAACSATAIIGITIETGIGNLKPV